MIHEEYFCHYLLILFNFLLHFTKVQHWAQLTHYISISQNILFQLEKLLFSSRKSEVGLKQHEGE